MNNLYREKIFYGFSATLIVSEIRNMLTDLPSIHIKEMHFTSSAPQQLTENLYLKAIAAFTAFCQPSYNLLRFSSFIDGSNVRSMFHCVAISD